MPSSRSFILRIDDYPTGVRPKLPGYRAKAERILDIIERSRIPYVLGVVPALLEPDDFPFLAARQRADIAVHGLNHDQRSVRYRRVSNELCGNSVEQNMAALTKCRDIMQAFRPASFIPPGNAYDQNLLKALASTGFRLCLGGFPMTWGSKAPLPVLHSHPSLYGRSSEIWSHIASFNSKGLLTSLSIRDCLRLAKYAAAGIAWDALFSCGGPVHFSEPLQVVLHWTWEWDELQQGRSALYELCEWLADQRVVAISDLTLG